MTDSSSWDVISGANSTQVVLSVDFPASRRSGAGFPDLASRIGPGFRFLQTRPPAARSCQRLSGDAYVGPWVSDIAPGQRQVVAVLGYRIGSVYAAGHFRLDFPLGRRRQEEVERTVARIVPCGLPAVLEQKGFVDLHLAARRLEQHHVLRYFGRAGLLGRVVNLDGQAGG